MLIFPFEWSAVFYVTNQYLIILNPFLIISAYLKGHKRVGSKVHLGSPQHQLSSYSISCHPAALAVSLQHQLSPYSIRYQPTISAVNSQHQPSAIISRPQSSSMSYQLPTSDQRSSVTNNQAAINHHLQPANY